MREEIILAIDELRLRPDDSKWFIPLLINDTVIPSYRISSVYDLSDIQSVKLYEDWNTGVKRILRVLEYDNPCDRESSGEENEHEVLKPFIAIQRVRLPPGKGQPTSRKRALHGGRRRPS